MAPRSKRGTIEVDARARLEAKKRTLLADIERALLDALAESPEVHRSLWRLQREGFTLQLSLDCQREADGSVEQGPAERRSPRPDDASVEPAFRIDVSDLKFLRSIGIDPTRKRRARQPR
jgi:hypothetical protein